MKTLISAVVLIIVGLSSPLQASSSYDWNSLTAKLTQEQSLAQKVQSLSQLEESELPEQVLVNFYFQISVLVNASSEDSGTRIWSGKFRDLVLSDLKLVIHYLRASEGKVDKFSPRILNGKRLNITRLIQLQNENRRRLVEELMTLQDAHKVNVYLSSALSLSRYLSKAVYNYSVAQGAYRLEQALKKHGVLLARAELVKTKIHEVTGDQLYMESVLLMSLERLSTLRLNEGDKQNLTYLLERFTEFLVSEPASQEKNTKVRQFISGLSGLTIQLGSQVVIGSVGAKFYLLLNGLRQNCVSYLVAQKR